MIEVITIANQKGGVGKSTTAHALGQGLRRKGFKVLFVDLDSQHNLTDTMNADSNLPSCYEVLIGSVPASHAVQHTQQGDIIPASKAAAKLELELSSLPVGREYRLRDKIIKPLAATYDYFIVDTPPSLGIVTTNALAAANSLIVPAQADAYSLSGFEELIATVESVKEYCNPTLAIKGVVLTRHNTRAVLNRDMADNIAEVAHQNGTKVFTSTIRENIALKEAQASQQSIFDYSPASNGALDYTALLEELLKEE